MTSLSSKINDSYIFFVPQLGRLPIEIAALRDCKEEVDMLFPLTSPIPNVPNWSIEGVISYAKIEEKKANGMLFSVLMLFSY